MWFNVGLISNNSKIHPQRNLKDELFFNLKTLIYEHES